MSHITLANQGLAAVDARNWEEAISKLSKALQGSQNPTWLLARSKALINVQKYQEALEDANLAFHTAYDRNKRSSMMDAHYRRAVAHFRLKQYANADCCSIYAMRLAKGFSALEKEDPKTKYCDENGFWTAKLEDALTEAKDDTFNKGSENGALAAMSGTKGENVSEWRRASTLRCQALTAMEKLPANDDGRKVTVTVKPVRKELSSVQTSTPEIIKTESIPKINSPKDEPLRLQEFQTNTVMSVSVFSKGNDKDKLDVQFSPNYVRINPLKYPNGEEKEFILDTFDEIDASASGFSVTPNKVELRLVKKIAGKWPQLKRQPDEPKNPSAAELEYEALKAARKTAMDEAAATSKDTAPVADAQTGSESAVKSAGPAYPTSSRTGPKNWDQITADENDEEESDVNGFFKKLFKNATPEQQRAMTKSFSESGGTSLSTDWDDVGSRTVVPVPPEGVEAKKW